MTLNKNYYTMHNNVDNNSHKHKHKHKPIHTNINRYKLTQQYLNSITKPLLKEPKEIDLVFSSGAFNGPIGMGVGMYLKKMEEHKMIKVKRVSGSSIGSLLSLWYIMTDLHDENIFDFFEKYFISVINDFKKSKNLLMYRKFIHEYVYKIFNTDDMSAVNKRLYITYSDTKKHKKRTVCIYKNRNHLIDCIYKSGYLPYITDGKSKYKDRYVDGIYPHFFENKKHKNRDILFVNMMCKTYILSSFSVKDTNVYKKLSIGINDANNFFNTGQSSLCIYTKNITYKNELEKTMFECIFYIILFIMDVVVSFHLNMHMIFSESIIYNAVYDFFYSFFEGFIDGFFCCNA